jgi:drug/metabolite transporter (DMT)-like permease
LGEDQNWHSIVTNPGSYRLGLALVMGSAIAWSTAGYFTTLIPLDNWTLLFWRGWFGALGILVFMLVWRGRATLADFRHLGWPGWLFAVISAGGMLCFITALTLTSVAHVAVIYGTAPFLAAGLGWLILHEKPSRNAVIASLVALIGVAVMVMPGFGGGGILGDLLAFGMTIAMALIMIVAKRYPGIPFLAAAGLSAVLSALAVWPFLGPVPRMDLPWLELALFGLVNSALGLALFMLGARLLPPVETALIGALDAPLAPVWVWIAFGLVPDTHTFLGGSLVFGAVALHLLVQWRPAEI